MLCLTRFTISRTVANTCKDPDISFKARFCDLFSYVSGNRCCNLSLVWTSDKKGQDKWSVVLLYCILWRRVQTLRVVATQMWLMTNLYAWYRKQSHLFLAFCPLLLGDHEGRIPAGMRICVFPQPKLSGDFYSRVLK